MQCIIESVEGQIHKKQRTGRQYPRCIYTNKFPMEFCSLEHRPQEESSSLGMYLSVKSPTRNL